MSPTESLSHNKTGECQRFFGFGKKIPKDVKRHCGMCRQHGIIVETRGHACQFKNCDCWRCKLVRKRRCIMSTQIRLRREQDKKFQRTTNASEADIVPWNNDQDKKEELNMCYFCQKCKNHGILMWKKDHKRNCEYANCRCEQCDLIDTRRALDRHIKRNRATKSESSSTSSSMSFYDLSSSSSPCDTFIPPSPTVANSTVPNTQQSGNLSDTKKIKNVIITALPDFGLPKPAVIDPTLVSFPMFPSSSLPIFPSLFPFSTSPLSTYHLYSSIFPNTFVDFISNYNLNRLSHREIQLILANMISIDKLTTTPSGV